MEEGILMKQYKPLILAATIFLILGATAPNNGDKELIIRLQGEVLVLQRQIRDLQESFDKWHGQSTASLQKISENSTVTVREITTIGDSLKNVQTSQNSNLAGTSTQLQKISEQLTKHNQNFSDLGQQINSLKQSIQEYQQKSESREKSENNADPSSLLTTPETLFATAYNQFNKGNYESALKYFRAYLSSQSHSEDSDDAQFWIAESHFAMGKYTQALSEYDRILSDYPKGDKTTLALLKKGITMLHLERRQEGVSALKSVIAQSPNSREAALAKNELNRLGEEFVPSTTSLPPQNRQRP
jgi:tol-pal system protein YbgF